MDHLRKAKKSLHTEREYVEFWKLLHDLVLVVLADFDVDTDAMRRMNTGDALDAALADSASQQIHMELVRYYLYDWGFVCSQFYDTSCRPSSQELLLALAWLFAFSKFFERLQACILEKCLGNTESQLPPYPN
uniref:Uncharacterized protein n=1 Tax=Globisporangium ultimum (strain ATCC 200006 / CBS 805.95 / DAOM BR144) TaxID=431595 RepID=K3WJ52_GLOUD